MTVDVLRINGTIEHHTIDDDAFVAIARLIGAALLDIVNLRDGRVMFVGAYAINIDAPDAPDKPINPAATALYHGICKPGTTHAIHGDVAIAVDAEFDDGQ